MYRAESETQLERDQLHSFATAFLRNIRSPLHHGVEY